MSQNYNTIKGRKNIKITVVGDATVGKTSLLSSYTQNFFPEECVPILFDNHSKDVTIDGNHFSLSLWVNAGLEEYGILRILSYRWTDCFILCYAVDNPSSLANVEIKWIPELKHHFPKAAILLVGTKQDVLDLNNVKAEQDGKRMQSKIEANNFLMCSAKTREGLNEVFIEAVRAVMKPTNTGGGLNCCKIV